VLEAGEPHNPVLESARAVVGKSVHVSIDRAKLKEVARRYAGEELIVPDWRGPVFPSETDRDTSAFFLLGNSINFAFSDFSTGIKYETEYAGIPFRGAFGMWAALKRGIDAGAPLLDGRYLEGISEGELGRLLEGNILIPMFQERLEILREVGRVLNQKYDSHFARVVEKSGNRAFDRGRGVVERLVIDFPSFADQYRYGDGLVIFNKRAQLAVGMMQGRFLSEGVELFPGSDIDLLTVFAGDELPKILNAMGILRYTESLSSRINEGRPIEKGSPEEIEMRASAIVVGKLLQDKINGIRKEDVNALNIDYRLRSEGKNYRGAKHHLTETTAY
jgi:hypothetical protein